MIELRDIKKSYGAGEEAVQALNGVTLSFGDSGLVSIVGPSGCGKTTLLNVIGGLDRYDSGDILVDGHSTKEYKDADWDSYRNHRIGFVFQSYSLIQHLNVLDNVIMSLALSGVPANARKEKALEMLEKVGLKEKANKRPNQLSGGQMQRVAIARALINDPDILLCDEPTGALDSKTSTQIMDLLAQIAKTRLVVMVTHNLDIARDYSSRVVEMLDGVIQKDSAPAEAKQSALEGTKKKGTSMSFLQALKSSGKNLLTKKGRTIATSIAGSIGIIGIGLVLSLSSGINGQVAEMERDSLAGFPISMSSTTTTQFFGTQNQGKEFPSEDEYYAYDPSEGRVIHTNDFSKEFVDYLGGLDKKHYNSMTFSYGVGVNFAFKGSSYGLVKAAGADTLSTLGLGLSSALFEVPDSKDFILTQYDILAGEYPSKKEDLAFVVDSRNRLAEDVLTSLGIPVQEKYRSSDLLGRRFRVLSNDDYYVEDGGVYRPNANAESLYESSSEKSPFAEVKCILRVKESATSSFLSTGLGYPAALTRFLLDEGKTSAVSMAQQANKDVDVLTGEAFTKFTSYDKNMALFGADDTPKSISIYPKSFDDKAKIKSYLDAYNAGKAYKDQIVYSDLAETITATLSQVVNIIAVVLSSIAAISLIVSSVMIAIIIYVSVIERTQEIGIMRALGARKKDITRIFASEAITIGFVAGVLGVGVTYLLDIPVGMLVSSLTSGSFNAFLPPQFALLLLLISVVLTFVAGIFPSLGAAKKDPVTALRER